MTNLTKKQAIDCGIQHVGGSRLGYFVTLNTFINNREKLDQDLITLSNWLNDYCYGNKFKRGEKRLRMIAGIECGLINNGLHAHVVMTHCPDMDRSIQEINTFIRKKWHKLIGAKSSIFGNLVNVQKLNDLESAVIYSLKDADKYQNQSTKITFLS